MRNQTERIDSGRSREFGTQQAKAEPFIPHAAGDGGTDYAAVWIKVDVALGLPWTKRLLMLACNRPLGKRPPSATLERSNSTTIERSKGKWRKLTNQLTSVRRAASLSIRSRNFESTNCHVSSKRIKRPRRRRTGNPQSKRALDSRPSYGYPTRYPCASPDTRGS